MRYLLITILMIPTLLIAEEEKKTDLPESTLKAVELHKTKCDKAEQEYLAAVEKSKEYLIRSLDREIKKATRRGTLEEALAIKALKEKTISESVATDFLGNKIRPPSPKTGLYIVSAKYGIEDGKWIDATEHIKTLVKNDSLNEEFSHLYKVVGDPAPGQSKVLDLVYSLDGKEYTVKQNANNRVKINVK